MSLGELVTECVLESGLNDYQQRSALGMAGIWVRRRTPVKVGANSLDLYPKRDKLACDLVEILEAHPATNEEYVEALQAARDVVNAPFQNAKQVGARLNSPGEAKKNREGG